MVRIMFAASVSIFVAGCATSQVSPNQAKLAPADRLFAFQEKTSQASSTLTVTRDSGLLGGGCFLAFNLDGIRAARFDPGETARFYVEPGEHLLSVRPDADGSGLCAIPGIQNSARETTLRQNETKNFRIMMDINGTADIQRTD